MTTAISKIHPNDKQNLRKHRRMLRRLETKGVEKMPLHCKWMRRHLGIGWYVYAQPRIIIPKDVRIEMEHAARLQRARERAERDINKRVIDAHVATLPSEDANVRA